MVWQILCYPCGVLLLNTSPLKRLKTKLSQTFYSLTVYKFSNGICLLIYLSFYYLFLNYLFAYLFIYSFRLFLLN